MVGIVGYHTCKIEGGWSFVRTNAPFLSGNGDNQWLTQGYYFWTDNEFFAHKWGKSSYNDCYAIVHCELTIKGDKLLDLVGSVDDQLYFKSRIEKYRRRLQKAGRSTENVTVRQVIEFLRSQGKFHRDFFPFVAIKAQDIFKGDNLKFLDKKNEYMPVLTRQQLCLFENGVDCIHKRKPIYPDEFITHEAELDAARRHENE